MSIITRSIIRSFRFVLLKFAPNYQLVKNTSSSVEYRLLSVASENYLFDYHLLKYNVLHFVESQRYKGECFSYSYSSESTKPTLYSSVYACLIMSMFGEIDTMSEDLKDQWALFFDSFQNENGLFYDEPTNNDIYDNADWWGARHLIPHILMAYNSLGRKPRYEMVWVKEYYDINFLEHWLDQTDWNSCICDDSNIDNKIMNIGVALQYQRDYLNDEQAKTAIDYLKEYLLNKINESTGFWGNYNTDNPYELARMIQFSYHIMRLFIYDRYSFDNSERMIDLILKSQQLYGGWGMNINSSACEDIDAINPLIYLSQHNGYRKNEIQKALRRSLLFVLSNQNQDGGFVFRRDESFQYGCEQMFSGINESAMFPTWFRSLCVAYIVKALGINNSFLLVSTPGY